MGQGPRIEYPLSGPLHGDLQLVNLEYFWKTRSIPWLLMPWRPASPGHQQPWYWFCRMNWSLYSMTKDVNYLSHLSIDEWKKMRIYFVVFPHNNPLHLWLIFPKVLSVKLWIFQSILKSKASQLNKHLKLDWRLFRYFGNASQINHWLKCFATGDIYNGFFLHKNNGSSQATLVSSGATADSISNFWILKWALHATHLLKLLDKMCKYEMDLMSILEDTERTRFCPQTDKVILVYPPFNFNQWVLRHDLRLCDWQVLIQNPAQV